jgi:transposase
MASKNDKLRQWAAHLYINEGYTQKAISDHLEVSENTIGKWKKDDKWEEERQAILASPRKIKSILLAELEKVSNGDDTTIDADALSKIAKVIREMGGKISPEIVHQVLKELDGFILEHDPKLATQSLAIHRRFLMHKIEVDG